MDKKVLYYGYYAEHEVESIEPKGKYPIFI